jgi:hypothetical protein
MYSSCFIISMNLNIITFILLRKEFIFLSVEIKHNKSLYKINEKYVTENMLN